MIRVPRLKKQSCQPLFMIWRRQFMHALTFIYSLQHCFLQIEVFLYGFC